MIVALIDNGSLEPAAHRNLRAVAAAVSQRSGTLVEAVSWKHSDRIAPLDGQAASTLAPWVRLQFARGERHFLFLPFFISPQGAIGSALHSDLDTLRRELGDFRFTFTAGLAEKGVVTAIVAARIRDVLAARVLRQPPVIVVDHGGPSAASAALRDTFAAELRRELGAEIGPLAAASMEGAHPPLLADQLKTAPFADRDVVVAPLFLSPGRHAGPEGDVARICGASSARCHLTELVGTHPLAAEALAAALRATLSSLHAEPLHELHA